MHAITKEIIELLKAGQRIFFIHTIELKRVERFVAEAAKLSGKQFVVDYSFDSAYSEIPQNSLILSEIGFAQTNLRINLILGANDGSLKPSSGMLHELYALADDLEETQSAIFFVLTQGEPPSGLESVVYTLELPLPDPEEILTSFRQIAGASLSDSVLQRFAQLARGLTLTEAVINFKRALSKLDFGNDEAERVFVEHKRRLLERTASLEVVHNPPSIDEVGGLHELKEWLRLRKRAFEPDAQKFGLPRPKGLLLLGVQGCGKSLTAKAAANLLGFPLVRLDLGALFVSDVPPDQRLREALMRCEALAPVVLWLDEVEKGFAGGSGSNADATRLLGVFLSWLQEHSAPVFVVATANNVELLPPEFVRRGRFDELFFVDLPSEPERKEILSVHLRKRNRDPSKFDLDSIVKLMRNFSGAEIEQVVVAAMYRAFAQDRDLTTEDLIREAELLVPLYRVQEEAIKRLREWAENRTRHASSDRTLLKYFE